MRDALELVRRDVLLGNPGRYGIADEQLHFPYLYESARGHWYMTYREGPHLEKRFGPGNRVQCVQSRDGGRSWLPWMGLAPEQWLYQLFITCLRDGSLISYRCRMEQLQRQPDGRLEGVSIMLRSRDEGHTWSRSEARVENMPFTLGAQLVSLWGHAIELPDGDLLWACYSREGHSISGLVRSKDGAQSFQWVADACSDDAVGERRELGLVRLESGQLYGLVRCGTESSKPMVAVRSSDDGATWSPPRRMARPGVCPQLLLLPNGVLVCSYGTRRYVHAMASRDGAGCAWSEPLVLYEGQTSGYSNLQTLGADRFRIVYQEGTFDAPQEGDNLIMRSEIHTARY